MSISGMKDELYALERFYEHSSMDKPVDLVVALRKAIQDIEKYHEREARTKKPPVKSYCGGKPNYTTPKETRDNSSWVGLTDEDVHDAFNYVEMVKLLDFDRDRPEWCEAFASACEATLRHRNGEKQ